MQYDNYFDWNNVWGAQEFLEQAIPQGIPKRHPSSVAGGRSFRFPEYFDNVTVFLKFILMTLVDNLHNFPLFLIVSIYNCILKSGLFAACEVPSEYTCLS